MQLQQATALRLNYDNRTTYILRRRMWMVGSPRTSSIHPSAPLSPQVPTHTSSLRLLSAFIGRSVRIRQCLRSFYPPCPFFFAPLRFLFFLVCCGPPGKKKKKRTGRPTLCIVVFGLLLLAFFSSPSPSSCLIGISRLRHSSPRGPRPRSRRPPQPTLSLGVAPRPAIDSDLAILSWANGRLHPKIKRSSRLLLGFAWVARMGVGPLSGPRSSRRARDLILCPCTSDVVFFFSRKRIKIKTKTQQLKTKLVCLH